MISRPKAKEALKDFVFVELFTDRNPADPGSQEGPRNREVQSKRFKTVALPLYVIVGPDGKERQRLAGTITMDVFLEFLQKGLRP